MVDWCDASVHGTTPSSYIGKDRSLEGLGLAYNVR